MNYSDWHIPFSEKQLTLAVAWASLKEVGARKENIPLIVKLIENPEFHLAGLTLFHGAVDLKAHDYIHILLGRGLLPEDEAFTIGYTMGATKQVGIAEAAVFEWVTRHLYPSTYQFKDRDINIFYSALKLAESSNCVALDRVDYTELIDGPLQQVRSKLGINENKIRAYYQTEKTLYPDSKASRRLLD